MIDFRNLHNLPEYATDLASFNSVFPINNRKWSVFKTSHLIASNNKCPICECPLDIDNLISRPSKSGKITFLEPTIDHYRPKASDKYPNLEFDHENYLLMCHDCNSAYKGSDFPLHSSTPNRNTTATVTSDILDEKPLIINPIYHNIYEIFKLVFKQSPTGKKVLELAPRQNSGYKKEQADVTIKIFSLGKCEEPSHIHRNININTCRIELLHNHFIKFHNIVKILNGRDISTLSKNEKKKVFLEVKDKTLDKYGFYNFIFSNNYCNLIP